MGSFFGDNAWKPAPAPPPPPPPPVQMPQGQGVADDVAKRAKNQAGFGATIVTGPEGLTEPASTTANPSGKTQLGG